MQRLDEKPLRFPVNGTLELTLRCNLHCKMCMFRHGDGENDVLRSRELTADQWDTLARQMQEAGVMDLLITGGEPLLREDFCEVYRKIYGYGFLVTLYTNATLVDEAVMATLRECPPHKIGVTFYGASDATYKALCGCEDGFTRALAGTKSLMTLPSVTELRSTVVRENVADLAALEEICQREFALPVAHASKVFNCVRGGCMPVTESRLSPEELVDLTLTRSAKKIREGLPEEKREKARIFLAEPTDSCEGAEFYSLLGCKGGMEDFTISYDGQLLGCQLLGNFSTDVLSLGFDRAWEEWPKQVHLPPICEECASCEHLRFCAVCPAVRMAECKNLSDRPEYICRMTKTFAARKGEML